MYRRGTWSRQGAEMRGQKSPTRCHYRDEGTIFLSFRPRKLTIVSLWVNSTRVRLISSARKWYWYLSRRDGIEWSLRHDSGTVSATFALVFLQLFATRNMQLGMLFLLFHKYWIFKKDGQLQSGPAVIMILDPNSFNSNQYILTPTAFGKSPYANPEPQPGQLCGNTSNTISEGCSI